MREICIQFGPRRRLAGIVTEPTRVTRADTHVLVSAGLMPKAGPFRLYAGLARALAEQGFRVLRFDLGGIGESDTPFPGHPVGQRTSLEIGAALELLAERFDAARFVLGGLCSGAEDAFRHAEKDSRVVGALLVDPFAYRTAGWWLHDLPFKIAKSSLAKTRLYASREEKGLVDYRYMEHAESSRILRTLVARRARLHFVYTGGMRERFNHAGQLRAMFAGIELGDCAHVDWLPRLGHTQLLEDDRRRLIDAIVRRAVAAPAALPAPVPLPVLAVAS